MSTGTISNWRYSLKQISLPMQHLVFMKDNGAQGSLSLMQRKRQLSNGKVNKIRRDIHIDQVQTDAKEVKEQLHQATAKDYSKLCAISMDANSG